MDGIGEYASKKEESHQVCIYNKYNTAAKVKLKKNIKLEKYRINLYSSFVTETLNIIFLILIISTCKINGSALGNN